MNCMQKTHGENACGNAALKMFLFKYLLLYEHCIFKFGKCNETCQDTKGLLQGFPTCGQFHQHFMREFLV